MHDYLKAIVANKQLEVNRLQEEIAEQSEHPIHQFLRGEQKRMANKSFRQALLTLPLAIIAEIKRRSPSKAHLAEIVDPVALAQNYVAGGAAAISVLTDSFGFGGSLQDLTAVAIALQDVPCPILRKDFLIDKVQIAESIIAGADAVLLIVTVLQDKTAEMLRSAEEMGIDALVEVNTEQELEFALDIGAKIIGVNNRNLTTFVVDMSCSERLIKLIPKDVISVAASGIHDVKTGHTLNDLGYNALLIGEALVKAEHPTQFIQQLMNKV